PESTLVPNFDLTGACYGVAWRVADLARRAQGIRKGGAVKTSTYNTIPSTGSCSVGTACIGACKRIHSLTHTTLPIAAISPGLIPCICFCFTAEYAVPADGDRESSCRGVGEGVASCGAGCCRAASARCLGVAGVAEGIRVTCDAAAGPRGVPALCDCQAVAFRCRVAAVNLALAALSKCCPTRADCPSAA